MSTLRKICLFLVLFGNGQTRACLTSSIYYPGDNASVSIDEVHIDQYNLLEIYFCGSTSKLHFSNVMFYETNKSPANNISVNRNYSERIIQRKMTNVSISFLLLNVTFRDSGNFTDSRNSCEKAKSNITVIRRRLTAYLDETFSLDFMCNNTNSSLVRITYIEFNYCRLLAFYNITQKNCTYVGDDNLEYGKKCEFKDATLRLIFTSVQLQNKGVYIAWDDTGLLLDSIFMDVEEKRNNISIATMNENVHYGNRESTTGSSLGYNVHYGRILSGQVYKPITLTFMCNNTNTSSIRIGKNHPFGYVDFIIYDVARKTCTYTNVSQNLNNRIDSCVLNNTNFKLILRELLWHDKGNYTAWDDQGLLLDSIFVFITDNSISSQSITHISCSSSYQVQNGSLTWLLVSAVLNVLLLACLAIIAVRKLLHCKGKKTKQEEMNS